MRTIGGILLSLFFLSCSGGGPGSSGDPGKPARAPIRLEFEKEISGRVLGYDLNYPSGVAVDAAGNVYIDDTGNHRIIKIDTELEPIGEYGGYGGGIGQFISPEDIIIDRGLNVYILDTGNRRVVHLDAGLNYVDEIIPRDDTGEIISNAAKLSGIHISSLGEITVADYDNSRLLRMDNFNRFSRYIGDFGYGRGALLSPLGIAGDADGRLYIADAGNGRIAVYDDYGNYLYQFGAADLSRPAAVAISSYGSVWVADKDTRRLYAFSRSGDIMFSVGADEGRDVFDFSDVESLAVSKDGRLFVADSGNNRIMVYSIIYEGIP